MPASKNANANVVNGILPSTIPQSLLYLSSTVTAQGWITTTSIPAATTRLPHLTIPQKYPTNLLPEYQSLAVQSEDHPLRPQCVASPIPNISSNPSVANSRKTTAISSTRTMISPLHCLPWYLHFHPTPRLPPLQGGMLTNVTRPRPHHE